MCDFPYEHLCQRKLLSPAHKDVLVFRETNEWVGTAKPNSVESFPELINDKSSLFDSGAFEQHFIQFSTEFVMTMHSIRMTAILHEMSNHDVLQFEIANGKIMLSRIFMLVSFFFFFFSRIAFLLR